MSYQTRLFQGDELFLVKDGKVIGRILADARSELSLDFEPGIKIVRGQHLTRKEYDSYLENLKGGNKYGDFIKSTSASASQSERSVRSRTPSEKVKKQGS